MTWLMCVFLPLASVPCLIIPAIYTSYVFQRGPMFFFLRLPSVSVFASYVFPRLKTVPWFPALYTNQVNLGLASVDFARFVCPRLPSVSRFPVLYTSNIFPGSAWLYWFRPRRSPVTFSMLGTAYTIFLRYFRLLWLVRWYNIPSLGYTAFSFPCIHFMFLFSVAKNRDKWLLANKLCLKKYEEQKRSYR